MIVSKSQRVKKVAVILAVLTFISTTAFASPQPVKPPADQQEQNQQEEQNDNNKKDQPKPGQSANQPGQNQQEQNSDNNKKNQPKPGQSANQPGQNQQEQNSDNNKKNQPKPGQSANQPGQNQQEQNSDNNKKNQPKPGQPNNQVKPGQPGQQDHEPDQRDRVIQEMRYSQGGNLLIRIDNPNNKKIRWDKDKRVIVCDSHGRKYQARIHRLDKNIIELIVDGLYGGERYNVEIMGINIGGVNITFKSDFWAKDNWRFEQ